MSPIAPPTHPPTIEIRAATPADAAAVSDVITTALRVSNAADYPPDVVERVAAGFTPERVAGLMATRTTLVAVRGGEIVGTAAFDGRAVRSVFVHPAAQRSGVGASLMARIAQLAAASGAPDLVLRSSLTARGFYARLGFAPVREHRVGDERTVEMRRRLAPGLPPVAAM